VKKERAKIPVPEEEHYELFGYPLTKEELNHAGRELLALGFTAPDLNRVTASWPPPKLSRKEVRSLQKQARIHERLLRNDLSPEALKDYDDSIAADESFRRRVALVRGKLVRGELKPGSVELAKLVALDLNAHRWLIWVAARQKDETFFKTLGKCLMGQIKPLALDDIDLAIVDIRWQYPSISYANMAQELKKRGKKLRDRESDYSSLRMREKRIRDTIPPYAQHLFPKRKRTKKRPRT
jgi:hypothetical protein